MDYQSCLISLRLYVRSRNVSASRLPRSECRAREGDIIGIPKIPGSWRALGKMFGSLNSRSRSLFAEKTLLST